MGNGIEKGIKKGELIREGKGKKIYEVEGGEGYLIASFKDEMTAFDGKKRGDFKGKGECSADLSGIFFEGLEGRGIKTHYKKNLGGGELLIKKLEMIKLEVVIRNIVTGSLLRRTGLEEGQEIGWGLKEYYYKDDELGDPLLNGDHIELCGLAGREEVELMGEVGLEVNAGLKEILCGVGIVLVDMKLEFGRLGGELVLGDEITPDTCRLWDKESGEILDKDRFRKDLGGELGGYREVLRRLNG